MFQLFGIVSLLLLIHRAAYCIVSHRGNKWQVRIAGCLSNKYIGVNILVLWEKKKSGECGTHWGWLHACSLKNSKQKLSNLEF
jgi:hypothetical protein